MIIKDIVNFLETIAPLSLKEDYDNAGLLTGQIDAECTGALISLDCTEDVVKEAIQHKCNLIISHHPIIFTGLKKINGNSYVERTVILAIKHDIAIYAIHTNLDNTLEGVNGIMAKKLGLINPKILLQKEFRLKKLITFAPPEMAKKVQEAIFAAGGGNIGKYSECSFVSEGKSTFMPGEGADPAVGKIGVRETGHELKMEFIFEAQNEKQVIAAMTDAHVYEEVAYDVIPLGNFLSCRGSGLIGQLPEAQEEKDFLTHVQAVFGTPAIKHTALTGRTVKTVALCGGAGSFLIPNAVAAGADVFITSDIKYHDFFDADGNIVIIDIGHYESEQFTIDLLFELLSAKFPNFALLKTGVNTNPVQYFVP